MLYGYGLADAKIFVETLPEIPYIRNLVDMYYQSYGLTKGTTPFTEGTALAVAYSAYCTSYATAKASLPETERLYGALSRAEFVAVAFELTHINASGDRAKALAFFPGHEVHLRAALGFQFLAD
jgi:hypothetical protein